MFDTNLCFVNEKSNNIERSFCCAKSFIQGKYSILTSGGVKLAESLDLSEREMHPSR